ncbi:MAG: tetratricopeptide repeat protein [Rhodospirillales bacterium]
MPDLNGDIDRQIDAALEQQRAGRLSEAETAYRTILRQEPDHAEVRQLLGLLLHQRGDSGHAIGELEAAVLLAPAVAQFRFNLGLVQTAAGVFENAARTFETLIAQGEDSPAAANAYAVALKGAGRPADAETVLERLTQSHPSFADAHFNLGNLRLADGRLSAAASCYETALDLAPKKTEIVRNLAAALQGLGNLERAETLLQGILAPNPDDAAALNNLANIRRQAGALDDAERLLRRALEADPGMADAAYSLGCIRITRNDVEGGRNALAAARRARAGFIKADWTATLALPQIYASADERTAARTAWRAGLERIAEAGVPSDPADLREAFAGISEIVPFALAYQGENDRAAMTRWGTLVSKIAARMLPDLAMPPTPPARTRKRIGFISAHFRAHTICNLFKGWLAGADRDAFEVHLISTAGPGDGVTRGLSDKVDTAHLAPMGVPELARHIHGLGCDALIYPDIGMDPRTQVLAALPLAPRQLMGWGHPVSSGLPAVDTFISSELMEPDEGADHYREGLMTLPGLSIVYDRPPHPGDPAAHDYLCAQALFKIMPEQDAVFASILKETPGRKLAFFAHPIAEVTAAFRDRLAAVLRNRGIDADTALEFIPPCDRAAFLKHLSGARVILDTFGWSGGNTSLEAFAMETPVVTLPGRFMRGRHTHAMLKLLELDALAATGADDYVRIATRLMTDELFHDEVTAQIAKGADRLFGDPRVIPAFNDLLRTL